MLNDHHFAEGLKALFQSSVFFFFVRQTNSRLIVFCFYQRDLHAVKVITDMTFIRNVKLRNLRKCGSPKAKVRSSKNKSTGCYTLMLATRRTQSETLGTMLLAGLSLCADTITQLFHGNKLMPF